MRRGPAAVLLGLPLLAAGVSGPAPASLTAAAPVVTSLTIFAGTADGLWLSRDWGGTWQAVESVQDRAAPSGAVRSIQPLGPRVYVGAERQVFISDDFGQAWSALPAPGLVLAVLSSRYPQADPTLFVGTTEGLLKSPDLGRSFGPPLLHGVPVSRLEWPGPALVVATGRGVLVSLDGGASFTGPGTGLPSGDVLSLALSSFFAVDPVMFAGVGRDGVFRSSDGGKTWSPAGLSGQRVSDLVWLGPFLYAATDAGVRRSEDLGRTWLALGEGLEQRSVRRLLFPLAPASGAEIFAATDQGIWRTADGGLHWQLAGLAGRQVLSLGTFPPPPPAHRGKKKG
jgi:ligand-binding sensor domain-containing protein